MKDDRHMPYTVNQNKEIASAWIIGVATLLCLVLVSALHEAPRESDFYIAAGGIPAEWSIGTIVPNPVTEWSIGTIVPNPEAKR